MPRLVPASSLRILSQRPLPTACFLLGWPALLVTALQGTVLLFTAALAVSYVSDLRLSLHGGLLDRTLRGVRFPATVRFALRQLLLILLLVRAGTDGVLTAVAVSSFAVYYLLQVPQSVLLTLVRRTRKLPVATRNIDLTELRLRDTPPRRLVSRAFEKSMLTDVFAMAGLLAGAATGTRWPGYLGCGLMLASCLVYAALLARLYGRYRGMPRQKQVFDHLDEWIRAYRPTVVLYFSGTKGSAYQANMWLKSMREIDGRPLVLLRERHILADLDDTSLPVLCVPVATDLMNRPFDSVRIVFYSSNVGPNIHMLRMPQAKHVFLGHGDSDKIASINPYAKVYDEVWTAGRAGRDRWAVADVGVRDRAIVEVGRPQLAGVRAGHRQGGAPLTILYAPTWEGWTTEPGNTSLIESGEAIVQQLLSLPVPVRLLYKPHPYTGIRAPEAIAVHRRIVAALRQANETRAAAEPRGTEVAEAAAARMAAAHEELILVKEELASLGTRPRPGADDVERSRDTRFTTEDDDHREKLLVARDKLFWRGMDPWRHQHITSRGPHLYSCFNECDLLVSDVSSVVSDFMASEKPYVITDVEGLGATEFHRRNPSARAAYLLSVDAHELPDVVASISAPGPDPMADARARLREYLLGPDVPDARTRFHAAVNDLALRAEREEHARREPAEPARPQAPAAAETPSGPGFRGQEPTSAPAH